MQTELLLARQTWDFPIPIHYGPGVRLELAHLCRSIGVSAPLVVIDRGSAGLPFVSDIMELLQRDRLRPTLFSEVNSNPTGKNISEGIEAFNDSVSDSVVALGGGSGMDAGKAISFITNAGEQRHGQSLIMGRQ